jgi:hypothetical protein
VPLQETATPIEADQDTARAELPPPPGLIEALRESNGVIGARRWPTRGCRLLRTQKQ